MSAPAITRTDPSHSHSSSSSSSSSYLPSSPRLSGSGFYSVATTRGFSPHVRKDERISRSATGALTLLHSPTSGSVPSSPSSISKATPTTPNPTKETLLADRASIETLLSLLQSGAKAETAQKCFDELSESSKNTLIYWVSRYTKSDGREVLRKHLSVLLEIREPLIFFKGTNLLNQLSSLIYEKIILLDHQKITGDLRDLHRGCLEKGTPQKTLVTTLHKLPPKIRGYLCTAVHRAASGSTTTVPYWESEKWGRDRLEGGEGISGNMRLLLSLKGEGSKSILETFLDKCRKDDARAFHFAQQTQFECLYASPVVDSSDLEEMFRALDRPLQERLPAPPYLPTRAPYKPPLHSFQLYEKYGAHPTYHATNGKCTGTQFRLHAPSAKEIFLVLPGRGEERVKMRRESLSVGGDWTANLADVRPGQLYYFEIVHEKRQSIEHKGSEQLFEVVRKTTRKVDPYARRQHKFSESQYCSVVCEPHTHFRWTDGAWIERRKEMDHKPRPMSINEIHAFIWKLQEDGRTLTYEQLARELVIYCKKMHFNCVELFGLLEHPDEITQGYHPFPLFAPNSRLFSSAEPMGSIAQLQRFVDILHTSGIGVALDFVPGHFTGHPMGLSEFDGSTLYERLDKRSAWGASVHDFSKKEVRDYVISAAHYWCEVFHIDYLRTDSLETILGGSGTPEPDAVKCMQRLNKVIRTDFPGVMCASEAANSTRMTVSKKEGGYGFDHTWNMGTRWNLLKFMQADPEGRSREFWTVTSVDTAEDGGMQPGVWDLNHDIVHYEFGMKAGLRGGNLYNQVYGKTPEEKYANLRLLYTLIACLPGQKLTCMGNEIAQYDEPRGLIEPKSDVSLSPGNDWRSRFTAFLQGRLKARVPAVDWDSLDDSMHGRHRKGVQALVSKLNEIYLNVADFSKSDLPISLEWIKKDDIRNKVISFWIGDHMCIFNFGPDTFPTYEISFDNTKSMTGFTEIFNSQSAQYGGNFEEPTRAEVITREASGSPRKAIGIRVPMPAYSGRIFRKT